MYAPKPEQQELIDRLMFAQANEAARCYEEKVLRSVGVTRRSAIDPLHCPRKEMVT